MAIEIDEIMDEEEYTRYSKDAIAALIKRIWDRIWYHINISDSYIKVMYCESDQVIEVNNYHYTDTTTLNVRTIEALQLPPVVWDQILDKIYKNLSDYGYSKILEYQETGNSYKNLISKGVAYVYHTR